MLFVLLYNITHKLARLFFGGRWVMISRILSFAIKVGTYSRGRMFFGGFCFWVFVGFFFLGFFLGGRVMELVIYS